MSLQSESEKNVVDAITGVDDQKIRDWMYQHVQSNQEAVRSGRHEIVYYPGCGADALRALIAYDATHIIAVDYDQNSLTSVRRSEAFQLLGVREEPTNENNQRVFVFDYDGRERRITEICGDARMVDPTKIAGRKPDILHIFYPTGALYDDIGDAAVLSRITSNITKENYDLIEEKGFIILDEESICSSPIRWPDTERELAGLYGLKEYRTVKRHPHMIMTSSVPSEEQIAVMDKRGYIYKKEETVTPIAFGAVAEAQGVVYMYMNTIRYLQAGLFDRIFDDTANDEGLAKKIQQLIQTASKDSSEIAQHCMSAGSNPERCKKFQEAFLREFRESLISVFADYGEFLNTAGSKKPGHISQEELKEFGFIHDNDCVIEDRDGYRNTNLNWSFAEKFLASVESSDGNYELTWDMDSPESKRILSMIRRLSTLDVSKIFEYEVKK